MKVICIAKEPSNKCTNSNRRVPLPKEGEIYTVIETKYEEGYYLYVLNEMPHDVGYTADKFIPLSDIDETGLVKEREGYYV